MDSHTTPEEDEVTICNHQTDSPLYIWPDDLQAQRMSQNDTECPSETS